MHLITESLLVGNLDDAQNLIPAIGGLLFVAEEFTVCPPAWIDYTKIPLREFEEPDPVLLARAVQWVEDHLPDNRVLVCCRAGMGRSVSVVIAYLCCVQGMTYQDAVMLAKTRRPGAIPLPRLQQVIEKVLKIRAFEAGNRAEFPTVQKPRCA